MAGKLKFVNYQAPRSAEGFSETELKQLISVHTDLQEKSIEEYAAKVSLKDEVEGMFSSEEWGIELVDVADEHGTLLYRLYFSNYGSATIFKYGTIKVLGWACQHSIDYCEDPSLWTAIGEAYGEFLKEHDYYMQAIDWSLDDE